MDDVVDGIFEEARRLHERQEGVIDDLRTRSAALLGTAGVVAGIFGVRIVTAPHRLAWFRTTLLLFALAAFVGVAVLTVVIHWGVAHWDTGDKLDQWIDRVEKQDPDAHQFAFSMACAFHDAYAKNTPAVKKRGTWFRWLCAMFAAEIVLWVFAAVI